jgi:nucleoid DNA-binding protein
MSTSTPKSPVAAPKAPTLRTTSSTKETVAKTTEKAAVKAPVTVTSTGPVPKVVTVSTPVVGEADMRKKELIDLVVERSGIKKKDAKPTIEAVLAILGEAIASGRELNLQPFGKLRINRSEEKSNGRVIVCKLRQPLKTQPETPDTTVAE